MRTDAVVVGAGPAGCAAAIGLARAGARVALYRRKGGRQCRPGEIIDPAIRVTLAELGLSGLLTETVSLALAGNLSIWDDEAAIEAEGMMNPHGLGALIDRLDFEERLISEARRSGVIVALATASMNAEMSGNRWHVTSAADASSVEADLLIQATGRGRGPCRGGDREFADNLVALLMYGCRASRPVDQRLLIEAVEDGWWYAAPLPDDRAVIAYMTDADLLPPTASARREKFVRCLGTSRLIAPFAEQMTMASAIVGFPASSGIQQTISGAGWVSIGDAAASYDPLLGRGVPVAMAKGAAIARLVSNGLDRAAALDAYADAERSAFADFRVSRRATYGRAGGRFNTEFWQRRS